MRVTAMWTRTAGSRSTANPGRGHVHHRKLTPVQNSQGSQSAPGTVTVTFPVPSNLKVNVLDAQACNNCNGNSTCIAALAPIGDYRWIIEEDKTFYRPELHHQQQHHHAGLPQHRGHLRDRATIPTLAVKFHTSTMDFVAQGCTGPMSCEGGQTMLDTRPACISPGVPAGCSTTSGNHVPAVCDLGNGACRPDPTGNGFTPVLPGRSFSIPPSAITSRCCLVTRPTRSLLTRPCRLAIDQEATSISHRFTETHAATP